MFQNDFPLRWILQEILKAKKSFARFGLENYNKKLRLKFLAVSLTTREQVIFESESRRRVVFLTRFRHEFSWSKIDLNIIKKFETSCCTIFL